MTTRLAGLAPTSAEVSSASSAGLSQSRLPQPSRARAAADLAAQSVDLHTRLVCPRSSQQDGGIASTSTGAYTAAWCRSPRAARRPAWPRARSCRLTACPPVRQGRWRESEALRSAAQRSAAPSSRNGCRHVHSPTGTPAVHERLCMARRPTAVAGPGVRHIADAAPCSAGQPRTWG